MSPRFSMARRPVVPPSRRRYSACTVTRPVAIHVPAPVRPVLSTGTVGAGGAGKLCRPELLHRRPGSAAVTLDQPCCRPAARSGPGSSAGSGQLRQIAAGFERWPRRRSTGDRSRLLSPAHDRIRRGVTRFACPVILLKGGGPLIGRGLGEPGMATGGVRELDGKPAAERAVAAHLPARRRHGATTAGPGRRALVAARLSSSRVKRSKRRSDRRARCPGVSRRSPARPSASRAATPTPSPRVPAALRPVWERALRRFETRPPRTRWVRPRALERDGAATPPVSSSPGRRVEVPPWTRSGLVVRRRGRQVASTSPGASSASTALATVGLRPVRLRAGDSRRCGGGPGLRARATLRTRLALARPSPPALQLAFMVLARLRSRRRCRARAAGDAWWRPTPRLDPTPRRAKRLASSHQAVRAIHPDHAGQQHPEQVADG